MKRIGMLVIASILLIFLLSIPAYATETGGVSDNAHVISEETEKYVDAINESMTTKYEIASKLAIVVIDVFPENVTETWEDLDTYKCSVFDSCGLNDGDDSYDVLIILAVEDRQYAIETGNGIKSGTLLYDAIYVSSISEEIKELLYDKDYDAAIIKIADHIESTMKMVDSGEYEEMEQARYEKMFVVKILLAIVLAMWFVSVIVVLRKGSFTNPDAKNAVCKKSEETQGENS